jgi:hypothetical protein
MATTSLVRMMVAAGLAIGAVLVTSTSAGMPQDTRDDKKAPGDPGASKPAPGRVAPGETRDLGTIAVEFEDDGP